MDTDHQTLLSRISRLEEVQARQSAELRVYRGALVWLMGVHQLSFEDANPRRAVLDPLSLSLDYKCIGPADHEPEDPRLPAAARDFIEAAYNVFLARQTPAASQAIESSGSMGTPNRTV